ncbi:MAG: UDP-N-acetylmuramoyl-L-alanyl-D-glutamate--2,6-diaminopimelate ligase [Imperialibacter sp.]|uniref:UDP-N-acetylmuramoyl-L-alanyl-D-glutamate--2, 6-diaminopimelate ligase n=1 Tax=Imperialibacter sp. TaxID=2038411 RepID=UPI0032EC26F8
MALLKDILYKTNLISVAGDMNTDLGGTCFDSRESKQGCLFIAVRGTQTDGHQYIDQAIAKGASVVVCEELPAKLLDTVTYVKVDNSARALGFIASNFYGNPSSRLKLVAVTGTNGKTTTVTLLHQLFGKLGYKSGLLSTVENKIGEEVLAATHTTPDAIALNSLLKDMADQGCTHCFMEASSHAIVQHRVAGLQFAGAVFTNITHDHLDYHGTFDEYIKAKKMLFDGLPSSAFALVNEDDKRGAIMLQNTKAAKKSYSLKHMSDFRAKVLSNSIQGLELQIDNIDVWFKLVGDFNAYNLLAVYGTAVLLDEPTEEVLTQLSDVDPARGRFQLVPSTTGIVAIVDYAHTPDALENVLKTIKSFRTGNETVVTVVGCGGNRDKTKRPLMAAISCQLSDKVILTSDNPRFEDPMEIIKDMQTGVGPSNYRKTLVVPDRKEAIKTAISISNPGDIVLVAGKGHETYQEIQGVKHPFDDKKVVTEVLKAFSE